MKQASAKSSKWTWLIIIVVLWIFGGVGLTWQAYTSASKDALLEAIKTAFLVLGGLGVILPTYFNIWISVESNKVLEDQIAWNKKENAFKIIEKWDLHQFFLARKYGRHLSTNGNKLALDEIMKEVNSNEELKQSLIGVVNFWDEIRVSILADRIDEDLVRYSLESSFFYTFKTFESWLKEESKRSSRPNFYEDTHRLYIRWSSNNLTPANL